jgi:hypothetical protein
LEKLEMRLIWNMIIIIIMLASKAQAIFESNFGLKA